VDAKQPIIPFGAIDNNMLAREALLTALEPPEDQIDLGRAALAIALAHDPNVDFACYLKQLDELSIEVREAIGRKRRPQAVTEAFNRVLVERHGFCGNVDDYYNPGNSLLHYVLEHGTGIPITLSIVYLAVAHRLNVPLYGVGLPLHFIVKYSANGKEIFLDPFHQGAILSPQQCRERVERLMGRSIDFDPAYLGATPKRLILYRLLNNLKQLYLSRGEVGPAGIVIEQMLMVKPEYHDEIRDRGLLLLEERAYTRAAEWLRHYLECEPNAADSDAVRRAIARAYDCRARLN
jgi:regulator of sirC expression with transglutaminase-like and TPR domain